MIENSPAYNYTLQHDFRSAEQLYQQAFERAERAGERSATALRFAQLELLKEQPHPFFWSPIVLVGRG